MTFARLAAAALATCVALSFHSCRREAREQPDAFSWSDRLAPGTTIHLRTMNGDVTVRGTAEREAYVQGTKRWRRGRARDVDFVVSRRGDDVYVCAIWRRRGGRCGDQRYRRRASWGLGVFNPFRRRSDVAASFDVALPAGIRVDAQTVNGRVVVTEAAGDVKAETVNGDIRASTTGGALALTTVNGSVRARAAASPGNAPVSVETVNGSVSLELPATLDADVHLSTVNGRVTSDFPLSVVGPVSPRELRARMGSGGRPIELKTVNGSVELKQSG